MQEHTIGICRQILESLFAKLKPTILTNEVLSTLMAEVTAIVNNRPSVEVSSDPSRPEFLTPSTLLTQKPLLHKDTSGKFVPQDLYTIQWRQVQYLANRFWPRWRREFLPTLQQTRKWETASPNIKLGDLVLLRCKDAPRNDCMATCPHLKNSGQRRWKSTQGGNNDMQLTIFRGVFS